MKLRNNGLIPDDVSGLILNEQHKIIQVLRTMRTDATSHNIASPTMLGAVCTCCVVQANERNNYQHCW